MASVGLNKFISESEAEEANRKRQEEWERVRRPEDPKEAPAPDPKDMRPLFDRLEEQRLRKEAERDEARQLKNLVKGLDSDEVDFLEQVDDLRARHEREQREEERRELEEFKLRSQFAARPAVPPERVEPRKPASSGGHAATEKAKDGHRSQAKLLAGAIKRKAEHPPPPPPPPHDSGDKREDGETASASLPSSAASAVVAKSARKEAPTSDSGSGTPGSQAPTSAASGHGGGGSGPGAGGASQPAAAAAVVSPTMRVLGVLPGLGNYETDSSEFDSDGSSDVEANVAARDFLGRRIGTQ